MEFITSRSVAALLIVLVFGAIFGIPQLAALLGWRGKKEIKHDEDDDDPPATGGVAIPV